MPWPRHFYRADLTCNMGAIRIADLGISSIQGSRPHQEDRYVAIKPGGLKSREELAVFAVYDGHGGDSTVNHLHQNLIRHLDKRMCRTRSSHSPKSYQAVIQKAIQAEDEEICRERLKGGATVALALIDTEEGLLVTADLGDSHIVLARREEDEDDEGPDGLGSDGGGVKTDGDDKTHWRLKRLSREFQPDDPDEQERIEAAGGKVHYMTGCARVGAVNMSRAMGDLRYKPLQLRDQVDGIVRKNIDSNKKIKDNLLSNEAHFKTRKLGEESLLLISSDGVGQGEDGMAAMRLAIGLWRKGKGAQEIAEELTRRVSRKKSADNCTIMIVRLQGSNDEVDLL